MNSTVEVRRLRLGDIEPAPYNPRVRLSRESQDYAMLKASIDNFGLVDPLVWNEHNSRLIGGHQRFYILEDAGVEEVDVSVVNIEDERYEKALNLALNKIQGEWDMSKLDGVLADLDRDLMYLGGFEDGEVSEMSLGLENPTDFLSGDIDTKVTIGAPEMRGEHPHRTGDQFFDLQLVLTRDQRETYYSAVKLAKERNGLDNSMDAICAVCQHYLDDN